MRRANSGWPAMAAHGMRAWLSLSDGVSLPQHQRCGVAFMKCLVVAIGWPPTAGWWDWPAAVGLATKSSVAAAGAGEAIAACWHAGPSGTTAARARLQRV